MLIGIPKEIKPQEKRISAIPASVLEFTNHGHTVLVEKNAGSAIGYSDDHYIQAGAKICATPQEIFQKSELIIKVKEPQPQEIQMLQKDQILFTYLHLAPDPKQAQGLIDKGVIAIAYETVTDAQGGTPLLAPMSEVAGKLAIQVGAYLMMSSNGGNGILIGGAVGVHPANVLILGGGLVGYNAARVAVGMGANVTVLDNSILSLRRLESIFGTNLQTVLSTQHSIHQLIPTADLIIGGVYIRGSKAPHLITKNMLSKMKKNTILVDVAIDQGGCFETSKPTTHENPTFVVDGVVHYCVANMPGAVPYTSSIALNNATFPHALHIANKGYKQALTDNPHLLNGLNICKGKVTNKEVAEVLKHPYHDPKICL